MYKTNFNLHLTRNRSKVQKGTRCTAIAVGLKGANIYLTGATGNLGLIHEI